MEKYYSKITNKRSLDPEPPSTQNPPNASKVLEKRPHVEVDVSDDLIVGDPGLRQPIEHHPIEIQDSSRRRYLAKGPCQPRGHNFPQVYKTKKNRRFSLKWFDDFPWLEYSVEKDRAYCLWCYLFANTIRSKCNRSGSKAFTEVDFNDWKNGKHDLEGHEGLKNSTHNQCRVMVMEFQKQKGNIDNVISFKNSSMEAEYCTRLTTIVDVFRYLLGEGLAFRGHDESEKSIHRGHFLELLHWYCGLNDDANKVLVSNAPKNNQMTSPSIQRDIIESCAMETRKVILRELKDKYFSLLIDEARDISVKEQMAIVLRFVNDDGMIVERFLGVLHVCETSALTLKKAIDDFFAKHGISITKLRGQGYDGASNMRGELNGLKALILKENKNAHYIHCFAHQLQLVVVCIAKEKYVVSQFFETLSMIVNTIGVSYKRKDSLLQLHHDEVVEKIEKGELSTGRGQNQEINLAQPGDTRWGSHYKTILRLFEMWNSLGTMLLALHEDGFDAKIRNTATGLIEKMYTFDFVFVGKFILKILGIH